MTERLPSEKAQRLRIRYERGPAAASLGHLDMSRAWEAALREAGVPVSYSEAKHPQPRITLAAGLPQGVTAASELLDVILARPVRPDDAVERVRPHLPSGIVVREAWEVGMGLPSLPAALRWADYEVDIAADEGAVRGAVDSLLAADTLPWEDTRGEKVRRYDLRPLVQDLRVAGRCAAVVRLSMRLRCDNEAVGRPDQVVKALGLPEASRIHRRALILAEVSPARDAWRRRGRFAS